MAASPTLGSISTPEQLQAAANALLHFQSSAEDFLRYSSIYGKAVETEKELLETKLELKKRNEANKELESAISVFTSGGMKEVSRAKLEIVEANIKLQKVTEDKMSVEMEMKNATQLLAEKERECAEMQIEVRGLKKEVETLGADLQSERAAKEDTASRLGAVEMELRTYNSYTANLAELNVTRLSKSIMAISESVNTLVERYFSSDIPDELFENHDKWIQQACNFMNLSPGSILVPATNSPAAKFARQATIVSVIAAALTRWIFTAAPPELARAGLDDILFGMMEHTPKKEALFRAILLSECTESSMNDKDMQNILQGFSSTFGTLAKPKARADMEKDLRQLFEKATRCWLASRRSCQKVVATFDLESFPNSWKSYPESHYRYEQNAKHSQGAEQDDEDGVAFFAFPAIIVRGAVEETVHHGILIYGSQLREAEHEWRKEQKKKQISLKGVTQATRTLRRF